MDALRRDLRYALRMVWKTPGLSLVAISILAVGIGANIAIFSVVRGVLLRPLPFPEPSRLVRVSMNNPTLPHHQRSFSPQDLEDFRRQQEVFTSVGAYWYSPSSSGTTLTGGDEPVHLETGYADSAFFTSLGMAPARGRTFLPTEDIHGNDAVAVLSDHLWQTHFHSDPQIVGKTIVLDGVPVLVSGVMPPSFTYPTPQVDVWLPLAQMTDNQIPHLRQLRWIDTVARLRPEIRIDQAQSASSLIIKRLETQFKETNEGLTAATVVDLRETISGDVRPLLLALFVAVALVLLMACANLTNLILARDKNRVREFAIRSSLGASQRALQSQSFTESILLAVISGALSLLIANVLARTLVALSAASIPRASDVHIDGSVIAFGGALAVFTGAVIGLLPAWRHSTAPIWESLKAAGIATTEDGQRKHGRDLLVTAQVAFACILLTATGLVLRSLWKLVTTDPGFRADHVLTVQLPLPLYKFAEDRAKVAAYRTELIRRVSAVPGAVAVGASKTLPLEGGGEPYGFNVVDRSGVSQQFIPSAGAFIVTQGYFEALRIPVIAGRTFTERDLVEQKPVVIINQSVARAYWPGEDPVDKTLLMGETKLSVIGVVGDVRNEGLTTQSGTAVYIPSSMAPRQKLDLFIRTTGDPISLAGSVRQAIRQFEPDQAITDISPLQQTVAETQAKPRFFTVVLSSFGLVALLLSALGIFGVISYNVRERTREIGVRMALGAVPSDVLRMVLKQAVRLLVGGAAIGMAAALVFGRFLSTLLYGVGPADPISLAGALFVLAAFAMVAAWIPARRATQVDPMVALRYE